MKVTLKDGSIKEYAESMSANDIAFDIAGGLGRAACAAEIDGEPVDLRTMVDKDCTLNILTFKDEFGKGAYRHTCSHVMAEAVKKLFPEAKLAIGPKVDDGFYYDFDVEKPFTREDLDAIEAEMKKIIKNGAKLERFTLPREDAIKYMEEKGEPYKVELIEDLPEDASISFYSQGEFVDLCAGPHLMSTKSIKAFKLTASSMAYWRGDENKARLQRIYGTAFDNKQDLADYLESLEEAKRRDHNRLGREMGLFTTVDVVGQGLPLFTPKGTKMIMKLQRWIEDLEDKEWGYERTRTPLMAKNDLFNISGHWDHYKESMFVLGYEEKDDDVLTLRPMTCPFQYYIYKNEQRSYRDLPIRYSETSTLFRNEASGEMHGLIRVRQFTISEGHLICTPEQLEDEFKKCLELAIYMLKCLGLYEDVSYRFSKWDPSDKEKYIGTEEQWAEAEGMMEKILNHLNLDYKIGIGEAEFYGPKLDIQIKNVFGKEDTLITIQIDQMLAAKFGMEYVDRDGEKKTPCIIHRTSIGCYERTLALLIEKYAGAMPLWIAPVQAKILTIADAHRDYAHKVADELQRAGFRIEVDDRSEKIGYKIREARLEKVPYMIVVGDKEVENCEISAKTRMGEDKGSLKVEELIEIFSKEIETTINK